MSNISRNLFWAISILGTPFFLIPAIIYLLRLDKSLAATVIYALALTQIICTAIKYIYPKDRPVPMPRNTIFQKYMAGSFPSIHTARITAFSIPVIWLYPNTAAVLALLMAAVGYSRIYLKKHYFTDVLAGFIIGAVIGVLGLNVRF
ncbi:phosphatase PAP2 family protein [Candidatus Woesearchaeota archaeon]|nr:phosphatase PAP2 family protein [Candidatus Woesearchaeota archaeon]